MIDWFIALLTPTQWEAWRGWLTTLGGLAALFVATSTYVRNGLIKREEQARLVYSKLTDVEHHESGAVYKLLSNGATLSNATAGARMIPNPDPNADQKSLGLALEPLIQATVIIHNGSKELIGPARVQLVDGATGRLLNDFSISIGVIDPESSFTANFVWVNKIHPAQPALASTVIFRDASGRWWRRHRSDPIEHVHSDPENIGPTAAERVGIRQYQAAIGVPESQRMKEPRVSIWVRVLRAIRALRGKSRTP